MNSFLLRQICIPLCLLVSFTSFVWSLQAESAETKTGITLQGREVPLEDILEKISEMSGYEIVIKGDAESKISVSLKNTSLEQSFAQILRNRSYAVIWDENAKKIVLSLYSSSAAGSPVPEVGTGENAEKYRNGREMGIRDIFRIPESRINSVSPHDEDIPLSGQGIRFVQTSRTTAE